MTQALKINKKIKKKNDNFIGDNNYTIIMTHSPINTILDETHIHIRVYVLYAQLETSFWIRSNGDGKTTLMENARKRTFNLFSYFWNFVFQNFFFSLLYELKSPHQKKKKSDLTGSGRYERFQYKHHEKKSHYQHQINQEQGLWAYRAAYMERVHISGILGSCQKKRVNIKE